MDKIEETEKKLQELKRNQRKEIWNKRFSWIQKHKQSLVFATIFLMLIFIILNQVTHIDTEQCFYIGEVKDIGIRWEGNSYHKTAIIWILFNDTTKMEFQKYNYNIFDKIESNFTIYKGERAILIYNRFITENTLLSIILF